MQVSCGEFFASDDALGLNQARLCARIILSPACPAHRESIPAHVIGVEEIVIRLSRIAIFLQWVFLALFAIVAGASYAYPQTTQTPPKTPAAKAAQAVKGAKAVVAYNEFDTRLKEYHQVQTKAEASLPPLGTRASAEEITAHKNALAKKIREARPNAKQGDIFTPEVSKRIREFFRVQFKGRSKEAKLVRNTLREAEQLKDIRLRVGMAYPEKLPFETVPAGLLRDLPLLPEDVQYRIVGHDLILLDNVANIVIDFIPEAKP